MSEHGRVENVIKRTPWLANDTARNEQVVASNVVHRVGPRYNLPAQKKGEYIRRIRENHLKELRARKLSDSHVPNRTNY